MADDDVDRVPERGVLTALEGAWAAARDRARVVGELAGRDVVGHEAVDEAAAVLGLSRRQVYALLARWRAGGGMVSDLVPGRSGGGWGLGRVADEVEAVIAEVLQGRYLKRQRPSRWPQSTDRS